MESESIRRIAPYRVWFSLTGLCNNRCVWCYRKGSETPHFLETNFVLEAAKTLISCGTKKCTIIGGEPTLHADYELIVEELTKKEIISCTFVTNGRLLTDKILISWAKNKKVHVVISLHGADENHYLANTGNKEGFSETIGAIKGLIDNQVNHSVNVVLSKENLPYIPKFIENVSDLRINFLCFTIAMPSMNDLSYSTNPFELANSIDSTHLLCEKLGQRHLFIFSLPWCILNENLLENLIANKQLIFNCPIGKGRGVVVNENGALSVCTHISNFDLLDKEKTKKVLSSSGSFIDFWNSQEMENLRQVIDVYRNKKCLSCKFRLYCKSGCPLWWKVFDFKTVF